MKRMGVGVGLLVGGMVRINMTLPSLSPILLLFLLRLFQLCRRVWRAVARVRRVKRRIVLGRSVVVAHNRQRRFHQQPMLMLVVVRVVLVVVRVRGWG